MSASVLRSRLARLEKVERTRLREADLSHAEWLRAVADAKPGERLIPICREAISGTVLFVVSEFPD